MTARAPYSRVYWGILDDEKFVGVRDNPALLGSWVLLLINADAIYPAPAFVPAAIRKAHLAALVEAGLIDMTGSGTYRVHGLASERERRADAAASSARTRWGSVRNANGMRPHSERDARRDETRRDEQRQDEEYVVAYFNATGRAPSALQRQKLWELYDRHGIGWLVENLVGDDPLGHAFDADTAWRREQTERVKAEEAEARREKKRRAYLDQQALMRATSPEDAA
jgi:hypothetical protein